MASIILIAVNHNIINSFRIIFFLKNIYIFINIEMYFVMRHTALIDHIKHKYNLYFSQNQNNNGTEIYTLYNVNAKNQRIMNILR